MLLVVYFLCLLAFGFVVTILASCVGALHCATGAVSRKLAQQKACLDRTRQVTGVAVQDMLTRWITFVCMVVGVIVRAVTWLVVTVVGFLKRVVSPVCNLVSALYEVATDAYALNRCERELAAACSQNIMLRRMIQQDTHRIDLQIASIYARDEENNALTVVIREMEARLAAIKEELQCPISVKNFEDPHAVMLWRLGNWCVISNLPMMLSKSVQRAGFTLLSLFLQTFLLLTSSVLLKKIPRNCVILSGCSSS